MCFRPNDVSAADKPLICPECGMENAPGEEICIFCDAPLPVEEPEPIDAPAAPSTPGGSPAAPSVPGAPKA